MSDPLCVTCAYESVRENHISDGVAPFHCRECGEPYPCAPIALAVAIDLARRWLPQPSHHNEWCVTCGQYDCDEHDLALAWEQADALRGATAALY